MILSGLLGQDRHQGISVPMLEHVLRQVAQRVPSLHWAIVASLDGVVQATYDPFGKEQSDRILAMVSSVLALGERVFHRLQHGELSYLVLAGKAGVIVVNPIGEEYVLAISVPTETEAAATVDALAQVAAMLEPALCPRAM
jgi:predicted regulator of Ras-like GTPase activity (Roadblock/LC7/MglB family)